MAKRNHKLEVTRAILKASVDNLLDLPADHPAFEPSFKHLSDFYRFQSQRQPEMLAAVIALCTGLALMDRNGAVLPEEIRQQCDALRKVTLDG